MMLRPFNTTCVAIVLLLWIGAAHAQETTISAVQARDHVAEKATVCGQVVGTHYAASSRGQPTFINLDKPYPNQIFTLLIWGSDRSKFGEPEESFRGKHVCVTGTITDYRGVPEIVAHSPSQIKNR
jgi:DNA/RNA endonuclease YhcR with UshA esterase domain